MPISYSQINWQTQSHFIQGQFWPSGIVVACVCLSVCPLTTSLSAGTVITHYPFKLGSPNFDNRCRSTLLACTTATAHTFTFESGGGLQMLRPLWCAAQMVTFRDSYIWVHFWQYVLRIWSGDFAQFPPQPPGLLVMWGTEWTKFDRVIQGKMFLWKITSNSLTANEKHDIPSQIIVKFFWIACLSYFLDPNICGFQHICMVCYPKL